MKTRGPSPKGEPSFSRQTRDRRILAQADTLIGRSGLDRITVAT